MAIKLNSARDDLDAQHNGDWETPSSCPDTEVRFKVRGINYTPYATARDMARAKLAKKFPDGIPPEIWGGQIGKLLATHILGGVEGIAGDDGAPLSVDAVKEALADPAHVNLRNWVVEASAKVGQAKIDFTEAAAGN